MYVFAHVPLYGVIKASAAEAMYASIAYNTINLHVQSNFTSSTVYSSLVEDDATVQLEL